MRVLLFVLLTATTGIFAAPARADLQPYTDYDFGEQVYSITTVKVDPNMHDVYLEGLRQTWVAANKLAKELGHIADYHIYTSDLPESGAFNLLLVVVYDSDADLAPSKARYQAFMEAWGKANEERNRQISETYPEVRTISGEYRMREILMK